MGSSGTTSLKFTMWVWFFIKTGNKKAESAHSSISYNIM